MADSTLMTIQTKVRRLTRSLTESQLTTDQINDYINTFILYDFPEHLRLFNLRQTFTFYTIPGVDYYPSSTDITNPLYQFDQKYITVHPPIYIAGMQAQFSEDRNQFYGQYPLISSIAMIGVNGDGVTTTFTGVINAQQANVLPPNAINQNVTLLQGSVLFNSQTAANAPIAMIDYPINANGIYNVGNLYVPGGVPTSTVNIDPINNINYSTGVFTVTFPIAPAANAVINSQCVPQQVALPLSMLFFNGAFNLRPIPDQVYPVLMEVYVRPVQLLLSGDTPELEEWWQYIAYGAAKKVFEDRMDTESIEMILPEYRKQETLCLRRSIVQQTSQRVSTIYTENNGPAGAYGPGWSNGGGSF